MLKNRLAVIYSCNLLLSLIIYVENKRTSYTRCAHWKKYTNGHIERSIQMGTWHALKFSDCMYSIFVQGVPTH